MISRNPGGINFNSCQPILFQARVQRLLAKRRSIKRLTAPLIGAVTLLFSMASTFGTTWYVNPKIGNDSHNGKNNGQAFKTINHACAEVQPGDTVVLATGVYFENVNLWKLGTAAKPITFRGETRTKGNVVITGANANFRNGDVRWNLVDGSRGLYSAPCTWLPSRVVYAQADLYPYSSLNNLKTFTTDGKTPGPPEGFFYDSHAHLIYVRLNAKYGWANPAQNIMKVGPQNGGGPNGLWITDQSEANFVIHNVGSGNIIIDGITFETPRVAGIATKVSDVTVQNCYFIGCRTAVAGLGSLAAPINNVTIQFCEYTLFPAFDDVITEVQTAAQNESLSDSLPGFWWWQRKDLALTYECGLVLGVGNGWQIKNNYLHDVVDAVSGWGTGNADNLEISGNVITRTVDNAIEIKSHTEHMFVHDNVILDSFEAINYEPMSGTPWPSSIYVAHNVIADTTRNGTPWKYIPFERGAFKFVIDSSNWTLPGMGNLPKTYLNIPNNGFVANNNTVLIYNGNALDLGGIDPLKLANIHFSNNLLIAKYAFSDSYRESTTFDFSGLHCSGNAVAPPTPNLPGPAARVAGSGGRLLDFDTDAKLSNPNDYNYRPIPGSPLVASGAANLPGYAPSLDVGAYSLHGPTTLPVAGVQPDGSRASIPEP